MTKKQRISATVDPEVAEYLSDESVNASGVVNRAVRREMGILESQNDDMVELRLQQVRDEREDLEERAERKQRLEERLEKQLQIAEEEQKDRIEWYAHKVHLEETLGGTLEPRVTDQRLAELADEAGCTVDELVMKAKEIHHE